MAFEFFHKQWICDFENLTSSKKSMNDMLEVTAEDTVSARKYMQISFKTRYFQDDGTSYIFSPCEIGVTPGRYDENYYYEGITYNGSGMYRKYMVDPLFIAFDTDRTGYDTAFTASQWVVAGWSNPSTDYAGWVNNIASSYAAAGLLPDSVNLYVFKIINLKFDGSFSTNDRYIPLMYMGNDPNWNV